MFRRVLSALLLALLPLVAGSHDWTPERWFEHPKSPRVANYQIQATLDWAGKTLDGREVITWRNAGTAPTSDFPLHLYLNAFKGPQSLFQREGRLPQDRSNPDTWGYCRLTDVRAEGKVLQGHFGEDETVYWVRLPRAVQPGESIQVEIAWESRFPKLRERTGWSGLFLMGAQWFPKVGVYQRDAWNCHAFHRNTEFFADFGVYDVELSLPNGLLLAHTGTQTNFKDASDITKDPQRPLNVIWKLHAEDVHDFAWAVMPERSWGYKFFEYRKTQIFYFTQSENLDNLPRQHEAIKAALRTSAEWFFPYPYPVLTVVDVPKGAGGADGMEYPTLITAGSVAFDPLRQRMAPEGVSVHEFGHQYFQGMLASNEVEEPWLDEGLTSWFTHKAMQRTYQSLFSSRRFQVGTDFGEWVSYWMDPSVDPIIQKGFKMRDGGSYGTAAYAKPTLVLDQLEALVGRPVMEQVLRAYTREMAFKHPVGADFRRIAERITGRDLGTFWKDFLEGTEVLDYTIRRVWTPEVLGGGWMESPKGPVFAAPQPVAPGRRGCITLERQGGLRYPITLWVRLEDKSEQRLLWDGQDRWITYEFEHPVVAAVLDPDGNYPMLKNRLHAAYSAKPVRRGLHYWSQMVWGTVVGLLQGVGLA